VEENKEQEEIVEENLEEKKEEAPLEENELEEKEEEEIEKDIPSKIKNDSEKSKLTKKQKIQIIVSVVLLIVVIVGIVLFFLLNGKEKKKESNTNKNSNSNVEEPINYQEIVNQYGAKLDELVENYSKQNGKTPDLNALLDYAKVGDYKISCKVQTINASSRKVYLEDCTVNDSKETYSYGVKEVSKPVSKELKVYVGDRGYGKEYLFFDEEDDKQSFKEYATIPCEFDNCEGYDAYEKYFIVREAINIEDGFTHGYNYYIYDYQNKKYLDVKILNPDSFEILGYNQEFYGVYYNVNDKDYIYSNVSGKIFNINGEYIINMGWDPDYLLPSGYVPVSMDNDITNFINLKSGKVVYSIKDVYGFTIDTTTQKGYIIQGIKKSSNEEYDDYNFKIYDSKGYELFDGEVFDGFYTENSVFVTWKNGTFKTYNSNYQNTYTSKKYDSVEDIWEDYILVVEDKKLNLIDYKGNVLTTFIEDYWNNDEYVYHSMLSGWYTENGKNGIYLVIQGGDVSKQEILKNNPEMTLEDLDNYDLGYEYYYIPTTKETGKIPTYIGGYAKPVLYLYPVFPTLVNVTFKYPETLTTTYPKYKDNWTVFASPNGDLRDLNNKYYYGLYWEENLNHRVDFKEGFYVTKENAIEFLEEKLTKIGFNDRERNEFIMYWLPILEKNGKSLVYFELTEERDSNSPIIINPKPNSMLRVAIHVKKVEKETKIKEQKLSTFERVGFTAVEWGGVTY